MPSSLLRWWPWIALVLLLLGGAVLLAYETRGTSFWADEWQWILTRRAGGAASFLDPHNQHLSLVPVAIYKVLFAIVGLRHYWPYRLILIAADVACALLVYIYVRRRLDDHLALLAAALIVFFGPGWQDILWPFQIAWLIAVGAGVAALLVLDRRDRFGEVAACVLLAVSLASAGPGLAIAIGLIVEVAARRRRRDLWIVAIPIVLYGIWWLSYQHTIFNRHALVLLPRFVFTAAASTVSALVGLARVDVFHDSGDFLSWGAPLLVLFALLAAYRLRRPRAPQARIITLLAILLGFWILTGVGRAYVSIGPLVLQATGDESRYLYVGAVFTVLLAAEVARGISPGWGARVLLTVAVAAAALSNFSALQDGSGLLRIQANYTAAELASLDLSRPVVSPSYVSNGFIFGIVRAGQWFAAERALGTPVSTNIGALPDYARQAADAQFIKIQHLAMTRVSGPVRLAGVGAPTVGAVSSGQATVSGPCVRFRPGAYLPAGATPGVSLTIPTSGLLLDAQSGPVTVAVTRYSSQFDQLGTLAPGAGATLAPMRDLSSQPWRVQLQAGHPFRACALAA